MPKLLFFIPCERAIINEEDKILTCVAILERLNVQPQPNIPIPDDAAIPLNWVAVAMWRAADGDIGKTFEQRLQIIRPSKKQGLDAIIPFEMNGIAQRSVMKIEGFVISEPGDSILKLSIRESGENNKCRVAGSYPIIVTHLPPSAEGQSDTVLAT